MLDEAAAQGINMLDTAALAVETAPMLAAAVWWCPRKASVLSLGP